MTRFGVYPCQHCNERFVTPMARRNHENNCPERDTPTHPHCPECGRLTAKEERGYVCYNCSMVVRDA